MFQFMLVCMHAQALVKFFIFRKTVFGPSVSQSLLRVNFSFFPSSSFFIHESWEMGNSEFIFFLGRFLLPDYFHFISFCLWEKSYCLQTALES